MYLHDPHKKVERISLNSNQGSHTLLLYRQVLGEESATHLQQELVSTSAHSALEWMQPQITLFGKKQPIPRLQCWVGDEDAYYRYSGLGLTPLPWPLSLQPLLTICNQLARPVDGRNFNSALCNLYRDGQDSMGWHSDDEKQLGKNPVIVSYSSGATRRFYFREKENRTNQLRMELPHDSLLVMPAGIQALWQHCVPKMQKVTEPRINITFRRIITR